jgi:flavin-dependent dehydrogenase
VYDVVVTGGSIAGSATAIHLARRGRSVLIVERAEFPRRKTCGEGLFPYGVAELERLGVLDDPALRTAPLRRLRFNAGGHTASAPLGRQRQGLGIQRDLLDAALLDRARAAGVEVCTGVAVRGLETERSHVAALDTSAGTIAARAFVAADGLNSRLRRVAGLDAAHRASRYGVSAHVALDCDPGDAVDVYFHDGFEVYRTPTGPRTANIAVLLEKRRMAAFRGRLAAAFLDILEGHPAMDGADGLADAPLAAGPFPRACIRAWKGNLVLVGDAAGFFDGISGDGMSSALATAPLAARAVDSFLDSGGYDGFRAYDRQRRAAARNSHLLARLSLTLARRPPLARMAVRNLARRPDSFARLTAIAADGASPRTLRPRDLSALALGL